MSAPCISCLILTAVRGHVTDEAVYLARELADDELVPLLGAARRLHDVVDAEVRRRHAERCDCPAPYLLHSDEPDRGAA